MSKNDANSMTRSQLAESILSLKGKPYRLDDYLPMRGVYDYTARLKVVCSGRQISKSASVAGYCVSSAIATPYSVILYAAPLAAQTSKWSTVYLKPFADSHLVKKHFKKTNDKNAVLEQGFSNGSIIFLSYMQTEADSDRIRGVPATKVFLDECQDMIIDALPAVFQCLGGESNPEIFMTGTAKTTLGPLEIYMKKTNQLEWATKCTHCGKWSIPHDEESCLAMLTRDDGVCCAHCKELINVREGRWVAKRPDVKDACGYHIPQMIIPARAELKYKEIKRDLRELSRPKFFNEVCGLAIGKGNRIFSEREARACCDETKLDFDYAFPQDHRGIIQTILGVDWSTTGSDISYTVITILGYDWSGKAYVLYTQRIQGIDILDQVARVRNLYYQYNCSMIGSDRGVGVVQGQMLQQSIGAERVAMINYVAAKLPLRYDKQGGFLAADRTNNMDSTFLKMKIGPTKFATPRWELMAQYWQDAFNVFEEESSSGRKLYRKDEGTCDDWFHSVVFANIAYMCASGQFAYIDEVPQHIYDQYTDDNY